MRDAVNLVLLKRHFVARPPRFHHVLVLQVCHHDRERNCFLAHNLEKEAVVPLHGLRDPTSSDAKQEEVDTPGGMQRCNQRMRALDGAQEVGVVTIGFFEPDGVEDAEGDLGVASAFPRKFRVILRCFQCTRFRVPRGGRDLGAGNEINDGALPRACLSEQYDVFGLCFGVERCR